MFWILVGLAVGYVAGRNDADLRIALAAGWGVAVDLFNWAAGALSGKKKDDDSEPPTHV